MNGKRMTLESAYNESRSWYAERYGEDLEECWQWNDEGIPNLIGEYLSCCADFDEDDIEFAQSVGIWDECQFALEKSMEEEHECDSDEDKELSSVLDIMKMLGFVLYDETDTHIVFRDTIDTSKLYDRLIQFKDWGGVKEYCEDVATPKI